MFGCVPYIRRRLVWVLAWIFTLAVGCSLSFDLPARDAGVQVDGSADAPSFPTTEAWAVTYGGTGRIDINSIVFGSDGIIWVFGIFDGQAELAGESFTARGREDMYILRIDPNTRVVTPFRFAPPPNQLLNLADAVALDDGEILVAGYVSGGLDFGGLSIPGADGQAPFAAKLATNGAVISARGYASGMGNTQTHALTLSPDGAPTLGGVVQHSFCGAGTCGPNPGPGWIESPHKDNGFIMELDPAFGVRSAVIHPAGPSSWVTALAYSGRELYAGGHYLDCYQLSRGGPAVGDAAACLEFEMLQWGAAEATARQQVPSAWVARTGEGGWIRQAGSLSLPTNGEDPERTSWIVPGPSGQVLAAGAAFTGFEVQTNEAGDTEDLAIGGPSDGFILSYSAVGDLNWALALGSGGADTIAGVLSEGDQFLVAGTASGTMMFADGAHTPPDFMAGLYIASAPFETTDGEAPVPELQFVADARGGRIQAFAASETHYALGGSFDGVVNAGELQVRGEETDRLFIIVTPR